VGLVALVLACGVVYEQWSRAKAARDYPPTGKMVEFDGARSHIRCIGEGSPTVVFESGLDIGGSWSWHSVHEDVAAFTRACAYDRAGVLWSEPRDGPRDGHRIAHELHTLLGAANEHGPYVMVGHSLGGLLIRVFDRDFEGEVVGFVLVDSPHPEQERRFPSALLGGELPSPVVERFLAATGIERLVRGPKRSNAPEAHAMTSVPAIIGEEAAFAAIAEQAGLVQKLAARPLVVLSAGVDGLPPEVSEQTRVAFAEAKLAMQRELAALSTNSDHRVVPDARHYIQFDDPAAVIAAIEDVVAAVRTGASVQSIAAARSAE
jgi:pimeloyl-ACP methyl ester carboxylesterase